MTVEGEGTGEGKGTGAGTGQGGEWRAQLPADLKEDETFTPYKTLGDFAKAHKEGAGKVKEYEGKVKDLEGRIGNAIPKLTDKSTDVEKAAYRKAMGVPDAPEGYDFKNIDGEENSPEMIKWSTGVFHKYNVPKEAAAGIRTEWNGFVKGMVQAEEKMAEDERVANEKTFHSQFKSEDEYKAGYELSKRFWNKVTGTNFDEVYKEAETWQVPQFMNFIFNVAKMTGEDTSPLSRGAGGGKKEGMVYDKSPSPPNR
jgi:hypothetical protein